MQAFAGTVVLQDARTRSVGDQYPGMGGLHGRAPRLSWFQVRSGTGGCGAALSQIKNVVQDPHMAPLPEIGGSQGPIACSVRYRHSSLSASLRWPSPRPFVRCPPTRTTSSTPALHDLGASVAWLAPAARPAHRPRSG